jgi:hypothetical protein
MWQYSQGSVVNPLTANRRWLGSGVVYASCCCDRYYVLLYYVTQIVLIGVAVTVLTTLTEVVWCLRDAYAAPAADWRLVWRMVLMARHCLSDSNTVAA